MQSERSHLTVLLDELQVAERAGADALQRWIDASGDRYLRGGLRVIRGRDLDHAALAHERLLQLGATPEAVVRDDLRALCDVLSEPTVHDRTKLAMLVARFPNGVMKLFRDIVERIEDDGETRALLEMVSEDDRVNLAWLREAGERVPEQTPFGGGDAARVATFLDAFRVAEEASSDVFEAWAAASPAEGLRGGLSAIAAREHRHAVLAGERLLELGAEPLAAIDASVRAAALEGFGSPDVGDDAKLMRLLDRRPDPELVAVPLPELEGALGSDDETRAMLQLIEATERASFAWLRAYRVAMAEPGGALERR